MSMARALHLAKLLALFITLIGFGLVREGRAQAPDRNVEAADFAVRAIYETVATFAGVPLSKDEIDFVKQVVTCLLRSRDQFVPCARANVAGAIVAQLPGEAQAFADCIWGSSDVERCASEQIIAKIPDE